MKTLQVLTIVAGLCMGAFAQAECKENSFGIQKPPENPEKYLYYSYGFEVAGICSEQSANTPEEKALFAQHPEGYYRVTMFAYIQTKKKIYNETFVRRSFDAAERRVAVEKILAHAVTAGEEMIPNGLSKNVQQRYSEVLELQKAILESKELGQEKEAAELEAKATEAWFKILAEVAGS